MAYKGRKVFTAGEVLTSSDMNSTVDQTVMVFASAAARDTAIPTAVEGMIVYLEDTNEVLKYDSANWVAIIETADDVITTEGDLLVGGVNGVAERLAIGSLDTVLTSDGTNAIWAAPDTGVVSNNFVVNMNSTSNNTASVDGTKPLGPYSMSFSSGDTTFDVYLISSAGANVGYSNTTSINASADFTDVVILGVANDEVISFSFSGSINNADGEGDEPGAGAYLTSITPSVMPDVDSTATVVGGNFGADTEITFESGATVLPAKSITVNTSTELLVTRPDALNQTDSPYTLRAVTTGVPQPTGSNANLLVDEVTAGADPTFVTTSPLDGADIGSAFSQQIEVTDDGELTDFSVTAGTITSGLTLNSTTGVLSGTPTTAGNFTFTITVTDGGGNTSERQFEQLAADKAIGGTIIEDGGFRYHEFKSSGDFQTVTDLFIEWLIVGGGGGGGRGNNACGGGGAGGYLAASGQSGNGLFAVTVGGGGGGNGNGSTTTFGDFGTSFGGGSGASAGNDSGGSGGSGGGSSGNGAGGSGTAGQGTNGASSNQQGANSSSGGGGAVNGGIGGSGNTGGGGGAGSGTRSAFATATGNVFDSGFFAGGGGASGLFGRQAGGTGGGGNGGIIANGASPQSGDAFSGGGGGGAGSGLSTGNGGSGIVIVRYAI